MFMRQYMLFAFLSYIESFIIPSSDSELLFLILSIKTVFYKGSIINWYSPHNNNGEVIDTQIYM